MEKEIKMKKLKVQKEQDVSETGSTPTSNDNGKFERYKVKLHDKVDADAYFTAFESYAKKEGWEKQSWVRRIAQCLKGKARVAMNNIPGDYDFQTLKTAVLGVFQLTF